MDANCPMIVHGGYVIPVVIVSALRVFPVINALNVLGATWREHKAVIQQQLIFAIRLRSLVNLWVPLTEFRRVAIFAKQVPVPDVLVPMLGFSLTYKNVQKWVKKNHQRKFSNIRTFVRKSLVNCKIYTIFAPVNGNKVNVKVNFMYIRSCQPLLQIHCQMPGVIPYDRHEIRCVWWMDG